MWKEKRMKFQKSHKRPSEAISRRSQKTNIGCVGSPVKVVGTLSFSSKKNAYYAYILDSLKRKNLISVTPLKFALNLLTLALKDSAKAFVLLLLK